MPFKAWNTSTLRCMNLWYIIYHFDSLIYHHVTIKYYVLRDTIPSQYFPWAFDHTLSYQLSADFIVNCSILCNIEYHFQRWCSYTCAISQWLLFQALPLFSDSFDGVYSTPFLLVTTLTVSSCYFIFLSLKKVTKVCLLCTYSYILSSLKIHLQLNRSTCYTAGFPHQCIYTLQNVLQDGSFYFVCI